jgi:hypothetical protein
VYESIVSENINWQSFLFRGILFGKLLPSDAAWIS